MGLLSGSPERPSWLDRNLGFWRRPPLWSLIIVLPWLLGATVFIWQSYVYSRAAARQATTFGEVTEVAQGNRVHYSFAIGDHAYESWEIPLYNRRVPLPGERVLVYYDSETPMVNGITDLHQRSLDALGPAPPLSR